MRKTWIAYGLVILMASSTTQVASAPNQMQSLRRGTQVAAERQANLPVVAHPPGVGVAEERSACLAPVQYERLRGKLDRAVVKAAQQHLNMPMGSGRFVTVRRKAYLFCLEPHYHERGSGLGPNGWHKGVSVYLANRAQYRTPSQHG